MNVVKSISKSYGVPGLRLGIIACGNRDIIKAVQSRLSIWNINSFGEFFLQIAEKYNDEYDESCRMMVQERKRFVARLSKFKYLEVYPSDANYVLCKVKKPYTARGLAVELWTNAQCLIKDCSDKKGFSGGSFVRLAVKSRTDNDLLINALGAV